MQFDGFHISVKASTSRLSSLIGFLRSHGRALLQTERAFDNLMFIFAAASTGVNSAEEISQDLDCFGCHILYLNKDFLTLRLGLWDCRRYFNSAMLWLRHVGACMAILGVNLPWCMGYRWLGVVIDISWEWSTAGLSSRGRTGGTADGLVWCLLCTDMALRGEYSEYYSEYHWRPGVCVCVCVCERLTVWAKVGRELSCLVWHSHWASADSAAI